MGPASVLVSRWTNGMGRAVQASSCIPISTARGLGLVGSRRPTQRKVLKKMNPVGPHPLLHHLLPLRATTSCLAATLASLPSTHISTPSSPIAVPLRAMDLRYISLYLLYNAH